MNLSAWLQAHRTAVLAGGGAGVVGVALLMRHRAASAATAAGAPAQVGVTTTTVPQDGQMVGQAGGYYDSSAYDVYDAIQPQLETLQKQIDLINSTGSKTNVPPPAAAAPAPVPTPPAPSPTPPPVFHDNPIVKAAAPPPPAPRTYTVRPGDTLWGIATRFYGSGAKYPTIYNANKTIIGSNPNLIRPGQTFVIPS